LYRDLNGKLQSRREHCRCDSRCDCCYAVTVVILVAVVVGLIEEVSRFGMRVSRIRQKTKAEIAGKRNKR
jgi:hypothetical protein